MIKLEIFEKTDFSQLINWINSPKLLMKWGGSSLKYPLTEKQLEKYMENSNCENPETLIYKAIDLNTNKTIGHISLGHISKINNSARLGTVIIGEKEDRFKGLGEKIVKEALKIGFEKYNFHRINLVVFDFNLPAIKCYEKVGFTREGLQRECRKVNDEYWNLIEMSILKWEWEKIKEY